MEEQEHERAMDASDVVMARGNEEAGVGTNISVKRKRTKRQRPQSPNPLRTQQDGAKSEEASSDICSNVQASEEECRWGISTEEEEEMANCLILLAQGQSLLESSASRSPNYNSPKQQQPPKEIKFTSRKFLETPHGSKPGYYVYECKTCSKTFPSFQALGGHRASHMRPKKDDGPESTRLMMISHPFSSLADDHENVRANNHPLSLNLGSRLLANNLYNSNIENELGSNNSTNNNNNNNGKRQRVHRCSTCGAEFSSGQALGGHMRRHRGPVAGGGGGLFSHEHQSLVLVPQSSPALSFTRLAGNINEDNTSAVEACKLSLDLDLNLPAPPDQDDQSKLRIETCKEEEGSVEKPRPPTPPPPPPLPLMQPHQEEKLVLTAPTSLVDCHN